MLLHIEYIKSSVIYNLHSDVLWLWNKFFEKILRSFLSMELNLGSTPPWLPSYINQETKV